LRAIAKQSFSQNPRKEEIASVVTLPRNDNEAEFLPPTAYSLKLTAILAIHDDTFVTDDNELYYLGRGEVKVLKDITHITASHPVMVLQIDPENNSAKILSNEDWKGIASINVQP